jgi:hypothetical protein
MTLSRRILLISAAWLALHIVVCVLVYNLEPSRHPFSGVPIFRFWDAAHYTSIILNGYSGSLWAFYPLYPLLVKIFAFLTGMQTRPEIAGMVFSTLIFAAFCLVQARLAGRTDENFAWLVPKTTGGWILFLFSPTSYIFHSHHTESLFLFLSFAAFWTSRKGRWKTAALLAGLSALTRNQGIFVALAVALEGRLQRERWRERLSIFSLSGIISSLLFMCYPVYQYYRTGDALTFVRLHSSNWHLVASFRQVIGTLWYANPWQNVNWRDNLHLIVFFMLCSAAVCFLVKKEFPLALYIFFSTAIILLQGELVNMFRFGSVLFPAWFLVGDHVMRLPRPLCWAILIAVICLNLMHTRNYALGEWAY